jgi:HAD superfamily hydrolase (TIGR01509 family)
VIEALLLDFDGLLYDTESASFGAWAEIYAQHGVQLDVASWIAEVVGRPPGSSAFDPGEHLRTIATVDMDRARLREVREIRRRELLPDQLMPGAAQLLSDARRRGVRTAIVTSNSRPRIDEHLARARCEHPWDAIVCADGDVRRGKPRPDLYLEAMELLAVSAAEAVAFEDSPNGVTAAKAAGLACVAVPNAITRGAAGLERGDLMVGSLAEVSLDQLPSAAPAPPAG